MEMVEERGKITGCFRFLFLKFFFLVKERANLIKAGWREFVVDFVAALPAPFPLICQRTSRKCLSNSLDRPHCF